MPPKKAPPPKQSTKADVPTCGLFFEGCNLPLWDEAELERDNWGDLSATHVEPAQLFVDAEWANPSIDMMHPYVKEWRRPAAIFSPFKPVVFRPLYSLNPYEYDPLKTPGGADSPSANPAGQMQEDDDVPRPTSRQEMIDVYRAMKAFRVQGSAGDDDGNAAGLAASHVTSTLQSRRGANPSGKRPGRAAGPTPLFMRVFNAALMVLNQSQQQVSPGHYAWELIHPQQAGTGFPQYNPTGKYIVKLFFGGAYRRVVIDDRLPADTAGQCLFTVTEQKEVWPALLAKAIVKALGPQHEALLFKNPAFVVATLLGGWQPQIVSPSSQELLALRLLRRSLMPREAIAGPSATPPVDSEPVVLIATCGDSTASEVPLAEPEESYLSQGIHPQQGYHVLAMRPYQNTCLLRLAAPGALWKGNYAYNGPSWSKELEEAIRFSAATDRSMQDLQRRWFDFWISWDSFAQLFSSLVVFRCVSPEVGGKRYGVYKQLVSAAEATPETAPAPAKVAPPKAAVPAAGPGAAAPPSPANAPKTYTKWLHFNTEQPATVLLAFAGLPKSPGHHSSITSLGSGIIPHPPTQISGGHSMLTSAITSVSGSIDLGVILPLGDTPPPMATCVVHRYDWRESVPLTFNGSMSAGLAVAQSMTLAVPAGVHVYKLAVTLLAPETMLSIMAPVEFTMGDERDVCKDLLEVATSSDAGVYGEHLPGVITIWFKRFVSVKQPTRCNLFLSTLPKGTDILQYRQIPLDAPSGAAGAGKGKPAPKASKGKEQPTQETSIDDVDDKEHAVPIIEYASIAVLDLDTNQLTKDTIGKIIDKQFLPNKLGYLIIAYACPKENYGKGYWRLQCTANKPFDTYEPRAFEETVQRKGDYLHNDHSSLFRYHVTVADPATTSIQLQVVDSWHIPFKLQVFLNDREIESRDGKGSCFIEHLSMIAPDKATPAQYAIHCTLDNRFTTAWEEKRRETVVECFQKDCVEQQQTLLAHQAEVREQLLKARESGGGLAGVAAADGAQARSRPGTVGTQAPGIAFTLTIHSSTPKVEVKEDNTIAEHINTVKASWAHRGKEQQEAPQAGKGAKAAAPKKGEPVVDESTLRFVKAKESREAFLANRMGIFIPYAKEDKVYLAAEDEPNARSVPMAKEERYNGSLRTHGGITPAGGFLHQGLRSAELNEHDAAAPAEGADRERTLAAGSPLAGGGEAAAVGSSQMPPVAAAAATSLAAPPVPVAPNVKPAALKLMEQVAVGCNARREAKKKMYGEMAEATGAFWAELRPDKAGPGENRDEDDKKKAVGVKKK